MANTTNSNVEGHIAGAMHNLQTRFATAYASFSSAPSRKERFLVLAIIAGIFLFSFGPTLQAQFYVLEEHQLITERSWSIPIWATVIFGDIQTFARFRPAYWLYHAVGGLFLGADPHLWHAATVLAGILACYLFYVALRKIGADTISSIIFVALLALGGNQNLIWRNLITQEALGVLLTAVAVWSIVQASQRSRARRWDILALMSIALAGLTKESFVILIPALLLLRWTCQKRFSGQSWREALRQVRAPLTAGALIFMIEFALVMVVFLSKPGGFSAGASGLSIASFDPRRWLQIVSTLSLNRKLILACGVLLWISLWFDKKFNRTILLMSAVICAAWLIPQVVLYTNGLYDRYLFPAIVSVVAAMALGLSIVWHKRQWLLWIIGVLLVLPILAAGVRTTTAAVGRYTAETLATHRMVEFLAQNLTADQTILMAGDSATAYGFEATHALPLLLKMAGSDSPFYLWPLISTGPRTAAYIAASNNNTAFHYPDTLTPRDVGGVIIVDQMVPALDFKPLIDWLGDTEWREVNFIEPYYSFSIPQFKFTKIGEVKNTILMPATTGVPSSRPLLVVDPSLRGVVGASPLLDPPPWGIEQSPVGTGFVWLGQGDSQGLGGAFWSTREQAVDIAIDLAPGPGRPDSRRTVELSLNNHAGQQTQRQAGENKEWIFNMKLQPGVNHFKLKVLDEVTIPTQPSGDTRPLLAVLGRITVMAPR